MKLEFKYAVKFNFYILFVVFLAIEALLTRNLFFLLEENGMSKNDMKIIVSEENTEVDIAIRRIDGTPAKIGNDNLFPVAVIIDNYQDARPNYGLSRASLVYETYVENGTTRFLALYTPGTDNENKTEKIGPVRSARPYFLEIAKEYDALLAHSGGSSEALEKIKEWRVHDLEEIAWWGPDYFWRVYSRVSPHNLFTSEEKLRQAVTDFELADNTPDYMAWRFGEGIKNNYVGDAHDIYIDFSLGTDFDAKYVYGASTGKYLRFQGNEKHIDALNGQQIVADNIVVQFVPKEKILDANGRISLSLHGIGKALVFRDGKKIEANWARGEGAKSRTVFYGKEEIVFKQGNIWIAIVPDDRDVAVD